MSTLDLALLILGMAAVTYPSRALPILVPGLIERMPEVATRYLALVPIALFAAVALPAVLAPAVASGWPLGHPYPWAAIVAGIVGRLGAPLAVAMLAGMAVVLAWRLLAG
jgi:branched-subunit amino acid transport protein